MTGVWYPVANLKEFGHALGAAFEINLGYSILLKLGNFSGKRLGQWVDEQKLKIIPPMAESDKFNEPKFTDYLDGIERKFHRVISTVNMIAIFWAILAAFSIMLILCSSPYCESCFVSGGSAKMWEWFLIGATPIGVGLFLIFHCIALVLMRMNSYRFNGMIEFNSNAQSERLNQVHAALKAKLAEARKSG